MKIFNNCEGHLYDVIHFRASRPENKELDLRRELNSWFGIHSIIFIELADKYFYV